MSELLQLLGGVGALMAISTGSTMAFVEWRLKHLEGCLRGHKEKHDKDIQAVIQRMDAHIDKGGD